MAMVDQHTRTLRVAVLLIVWLTSAVYAWHYLDRGWWPDNAGAFALSAERVLDGELPHRDFDEIYTGGLSYLHALAFKALGTNLAAMRRPLFLVFLTWIPAVYYIATRFTTPVLAGLVSLLAASWSLPIYSEPIASWYNLFLATHGAAAVLRYVETERRKWLLAAGMCGGLSVLAKIIGLYFLVAVGFSLLFWEQSNRRGQAGEHAAAFIPRWYPFVLTSGVLGFVAALSLMVLRTTGGMGILHFVVPIAAIVAVLVRNELIGHHAGARSRMREHWRLLLPVVLGVSLTVGPYLVPYVLSGSLGDLARGLFVRPGKRFDVTALPPPGLSWVAPPAMLMLASARQWSPKRVHGIATILGVGLAWVVWHGGSAPYYPEVVSSIRAIVPIAVVGGSLWLLLHGWSAQAPDDDDSHLVARHAQASCMVFTVLAVTALCGLVQFPVAEDIYCFFIAPLGLLALLAASSYQKSAARPVFVVVVLFYLIFTVLRIDRTRHDRGTDPVPDDQTERLDLDRAGGIRVRAEDKALYEALVRVVRSLSSGSYIFASPDCPEVYFLSGFRNPTRTTYDFLDDPEGRVARIKEAIEKRNVSVVVLNHHPQYSEGPPGDLLLYLWRRYPREFDVGDFEVRSR